MNAQGCIIVLLFIIAAVAFPPLLLVIPFLAVGLMISLLANSFKGTKRSKHATTGHSAPLRASGGGARRHEFKGMTCVHCGRHLFDLTPNEYCPGSRR